jgi:hypothetical protein
MHEQALPTARQIYALAAALCERMGEEFPETRAAASATIERLRIENGHPAPRVEDTPLVRGRARRRRKSTGETRPSAAAAQQLVEELQ